MSNVIPAAGVILLNQSRSDSTFKVLLLKRHPELKVHGGHWVFPGGKIDAEDYAAASLNPSEIDIRTPPALAQTDYLLVARQAALRETQEEAGICLKADQLRLHSRWLTPKVLNKRFDTCFFIAGTSECEVKVDGTEIIDYQWRSPADSLALHQQGKIAMPPATFVSLCHLSKFTEAATAIEQLCKCVPYYRPKLISTSLGLCSLYEEDAGYADEDYAAKGKRHRLNMVSGGFEYICD